MKASRGHRSEDQSPFRPIFCVDLVAISSLPAWALLLAPVNVLDMAPFLHGYVGWWEELVPGAVAHGRATEIPQVGCAR